MKPLTGPELNELGDYNRLRARGVLHSSDYVERMEALQDRFDSWTGSSKPYRGWTCNCIRCRIERWVNRVIVVVLVLGLGYFALHVIAYGLKGM